VPHERISILPHPTPEFAFAPPAGDEQATLDRLDVPQPYVFYPAQFWPHKNHANLLAAVRLLRDEYDLRIGLVLVGSDKGNRAYVDQLIDRGNLADQVCLPGFVSQDELLTLYRNALALTYVTHFGPENLPPLEAFAAGCPVIASNVSGSSEQLADAVVPVDPCQPQEIATAIHRLHTDPDLRTQLITRGRERSTRFRAPDFVRGVFAMLDELEPLRQTWPGSDQLWP